MPSGLNTTHPAQPAVRAWFNAPLAWAATAFAAGIWMAGRFSASPALWGWSAALLVLCAVVAVALSKTRPAHIAALLALVCTGAFGRLLAPVTPLTMPPSEFLYDEDSAVEVEGHVTSDGALLAGRAPRERFDLETEVIRLGGLEFTKPIGIRATVFAKNSKEDPAEQVAEFPDLAYGDRVRFTARLRLPRNFHNPGSFDYEGYLHSLGISTMASVKTENIQVLPGRLGQQLGFWRSRIRRNILAHMGAGGKNGVWDGADVALFAAMIVGDDSMIFRNVRDEFQTTGVYHLLVVSGMNVALLALAVFWLARRLRAPEWAASLFTLALSTFYAYVAGMGIPIQRAVLMLALFLVARLFYRDRGALNATGFAALGVLVLSPASLFDPGFQLTFLALLAIFGIGLPVLERTSTHYRSGLRHLDSTSYDLTLEPRMAQLRLDLRLLAGRLGAFIGKRPARWLVVATAGVLLSAYELMVVSSITQAVLVLPMRAYFHRAAIVGLPANLLVLPLAGLMLNGGVAAIALSYLSMPVARVAGRIASASLHWTLRCLGWLSHLHVSQWRVPDPGWIIWLVATTGILASLFAVRRRRALAWAGLALLFVTSGMTAFYVEAPHIESGKLEITAIDVGQGDSLLIVSPQGLAMLVDGGGAIGPSRGEFDFGEDVVSPYLWSRGLERLDVLVLTHAHGDHIGGLPRVLQNFHPRELWMGINPETGALDRLLAYARAQHVSVRRHTAGDEFDWSGTHIRVLSPPPHWRPKPEPKNDDSLAFLISLGETRALMAGDLEKKMEQFVARESPHADVLKVAHHGSATSTTAELLRAVHPHFAVISAGYRNSFGHPRAEVLGRLQQAHVATYRTDLQGAVTFLLDGKTVEAHAFMGEH